MLGITQADLDNWFVYHAPRDGQQQRYVEIREAAKHFAQVLLMCTPPGPDQSAAIRKIRETAMTANQAIACEDELTSGRFHPHNRMSADSGEANE
jgi:hypothetical protein